MSTALKNQPQQKPNLQSVPAFNTLARVGYKNANKNKRVIAFILDCLALAVVLAAIDMIPLTASVSEAQAKLIDSAIDLLVTSFYFVYCTLAFGSTPGKKIMGLKLIHADHKTDLSVGQLFLRETVGRFLSAFPLLLGYFWVSFNKDSKTFHDLIAKTHVVEYR